jgi:hypothetical protein
MARIGPIIILNPVTPEDGKNVIVCDDEAQAKEVLNSWVHRGRPRVRGRDRTTLARIPIRGHQPTKGSGGPRNPPKGGSAVPGPGSQRERDHEAMEALRNGDVAVRFAGGVWHARQKVGHIMYETRTDEDLTAAILAALEVDVG